MSNVLVSPSDLLVRAGPARSLAAAAVALTLAAGGAALAISRDDPAAPAHKSAATSAPLLFGDPAVVKGAHGGPTARVALQGQASAPTFGDPTVHKGAGGR